MRTVFKFFDAIEWFPFKRKFILYEEFTEKHCKDIGLKEFINYVHNLPPNEERLWHILNNNCLAGSYCCYFNIYPSNFIKNTIGLGALSTIKIDDKKTDDEKNYYKILNSSNKRRFFRR